MKTLKTLSLLAVSFLVLAISSCNDDDPIPVNQEELITTMTFTLTPTAGGDPAIFQFKDPDGIGGEQAIILSDTLEANTTYTGSMELLNESVNPTVNVTEEIEEEDEAHQFFFEISSGLELNYTYGDQDEQGNPLGLKTNWTTGMAGIGTLKAILRHEPEKNAAGVPEGDITLAGGETDIEVEWSIVIQ